MPKVKVGDIVKKTWGMEDYIIGIVMEIEYDGIGGRDYGHKNYQLKVLKRRGNVFSNIMSTGDVVILKNKEAFLEIL